MYPILLKHRYENSGIRQNVHGLKPLNWILWEIVTKKVDQTNSHFID